MTENQVEHSYRVLKWISRQAVSAKNLPKMISDLCKVMRGEYIESNHPSFRVTMESLCVPQEYREAVLEKVIRGMLILNGWSNDDPKLEEAVQRVVIQAKSFDKNWGV